VSGIRNAIRVAKIATGYGLEPDREVRVIAPVIAHKLWGEAKAEKLTAAQKRQVREFAVAILKAQREAKQE
jgi:hypothetical protein